MISVVSYVIHYVIDRWKSLPLQARQNPFEVMTQFQGCRGPFTFAPPESSPSGQFWGIYALIGGVRVKKPRLFRFIDFQVRIFTFSCQTLQIYLHQLELLLFRNVQNSSALVNICV